MAGRFSRLPFGTTAIAMLAFAANSLLCRLALKETPLDAASFTVIRIISGAVMLWLLMIWRLPQQRVAGSWLSAAMLSVYALGFSLAYLHLNTGSGALLLFGAVQLTMIIWGIAKGERPAGMALVGMGGAFAGILLLLLPGASVPPFSSALTMVVAGIAWGIYSLAGAGGAPPLAATCGNFLRAIPLVVVGSLPLLSSVKLEGEGVLLAILSGALASGVGYAIWYKALTSLSALQAGIVQLSVPVLAALGGTLLLAEPLSLRMLIASIAVLGGVALVLITRSGS